MEWVSKIFAILAMWMLAESNLATAQPALPNLLPEDLEMELALSALPVHLRDGAGVYVLARGGYALHRETTNGFVCMVRRHGAVPGTFSDAIIPICYDREGTETVLPAVLDEVRMIEEGKDNQTVAAAIERKWENGDYREPGPGVSYMLSPVFRLNGRDNGYVPHVMFYSPYKTDAEVGASNDRFDYVPFIQAPGLPSAVMVMPVGENERRAIAEQESGLIQRLADYMASL